MDGCGFKTLARSSRKASRLFLVKVQAEEKFGHRTYNHYIQGIDSFCQLVRSTKRLIANPLLELERLNAATDVRHKRRALTPDDSPSCCVGPRQRRLHPRIRRGDAGTNLHHSYMTGLRRG